MKLSLVRSNWIAALMLLGLITFVTACGPGNTGEGDVEDNAPQQTQTSDEGDEDEEDEGEDEEGEDEEGENN